MSIRLDLVCLRHGTTGWTRSGRYSGISDPELAPEGQAEAAGAARRLAGLRFDRVAVSPLVRCQATWDLVSPVLGGTPPVRTEPRIREIHYGAWEGRTRAEIRAETPDAFASWDRDPTAAPPPGGESVAEVENRIEAWLADEFAAGGGRVLLVSHRTVLRILVARTLDIPRAHYRQRLDHGPAAVSVLQLWAPDAGRLLGYNLPPLPEGAPTSPDLERLLS